MKDVKKRCGNCGHEHAIGILRYSQDNVPLYGARHCVAHVVRDNGQGVNVQGLCGCDRFVEAVEGAENLPALNQAETKALWASTAFLNPQVPLATRIAVRQIMDLVEGSTAPPPAGAGELAATPLLSAPAARAVSEFMGLMISQITDIRGALTRDDSKFAHLVSHTDEIVEAMRAVVQLSERLTNIIMALENTQERLDKLEGLVVQTAKDVTTLAHPPMAVDLAPINDWKVSDKGMGAVEAHDYVQRMCQREDEPCWQVACGHKRDEHVDLEGPCRASSTWPACECDAFLGQAAAAEARAVFLHKTASLRDEPILTDAADSTGSDSD